VVQVAVSVGAQLVAENRTGEVLEVLDADGRPFLRIGRDGVEGDLAATAFHVTANPAAGTVSPVGSDTPRWIRLSTDPSWGWFDHRIHPEQVAVGKTWEVPLRLGGRPLTVRGHLERRSVTGTFGAALLGKGPAITGVDVQVVPGRLPAVFLRSKGPTVTVLGGDGEPFLRIGPDGAHANIKSPSWVQHLRAQGAEPDVPADADADPVFEQVSASSSFTWLESRGLYAGEPPGAASKAVRLVTWSVPLEVDGVTAVIEGETTWTPAVRGATSSGLPLVPLVGLTVVACAAVVLLLVRRRPRDPSTPG
jgi:hypothetical protein